MGADGVGDARAEVLSSPWMLHVILSYLPPAELLKHVPLVCKAFARAAEWCWDHLHVDGLQLGPTAPTAAAALEFWSRLAAWAARRAAAISSLRLSNLRHLLRELDEEQRRAALAQLWAALAPSGGGGSPRIHTLHLGRSSVALGPGTLADMAALASLHSVTVHSAGPMDWSELDVLAGGLPCLEQLTVCLMRQRGVHCAFRGAFPAALTRLPRLRALCLEAPYSALGAPLCVLPEGIAAWAPQMRELHLINLGLEALPPAIGKLTGLRELCLARNRLGLRPDAIPAELAELQALRRLELQYNNFDAGPPAVVGELTGLEELNFSGNLWGSAASDLPQAYSQLRHLRFLTLTNCELAALPPVVAGLSSLKLLKLNINKLQTLPGGPYLESLECLDLAHNRFSEGYPPALGAATRLQLLAFQHRGVHYSDPALALRDAAAPSPRLPPGPAALAAVAALAAQPGAHLLPAAVLEILEPVDVGQA